MKKLMISTIILLPILLLAILLVSGAIMSMIVHVYVESVEFRENGTLVLVMDDEENPPAEQLEVNIFPLKANNRGLIFSAEDDSIIAVDEKGVVTAKFYGETYVSVASSENKGATATRKVIVTDRSVHKLVINGGYQADMYEGATQQLSVTIYPQEAANKSVIWESSDESKVSVGADGVVTAKGAGKATITATSADNAEAKASIEIAGHKKIGDIEFDQKPVVTALTQSKFPAITPIPADADITLEYLSSDPAIATVDGDGNIQFLKEGKVTITVRATDFGGGIVEKRKDYTSTDGYYLPPLFKDKSPTVNFDDYYNENDSENKPLPIPFAAELEHSYRQFIGVTYSVDNVLGFDEQTMEFRFVGPMPVDTSRLEVTVTAMVYDTAERKPVEYVDHFILTVLRNATDVSVSYKGTDNVAVIPVSQKTLTFTGNKQNGDDGSFAVIGAKPENHTNTISYSLEEEAGGVASIAPNGVLTFQKEGSVRVKIQLRDDKGAATAEKTIEVVYTPIKTGEKPVGIDKENEEPAKLSLRKEGEQADTGVISFVSSEDMVVSYTVEEGADVVELEKAEGVCRIIPKKGGFATVKITETPKTGAAARGVRAAAAGETKTYTIYIYVDTPVETADFEVRFNGSPCADTFRTSLGEVSYSVNVTDRNGSLAGKKLYVVSDGTRNTAEDGIYTLTGTISFGSKTSLAFTFGVEYAQKAKDLGAKDGLSSVSRTVTTSKGTLDEHPEVTYEDGTPQNGTLKTEGTELTFADIGEQIVLTVGEGFSPADFVLKDHKPEIVTNTYVSVSVSEDGRRIALTAQQVCEAHGMTLAIGGKTFTFTVTVHALAQELAVTCGDTAMESDSYETLLEALTFHVTIPERKDGKQITNKGVEYSCDRDTWTKIKGGDVTIRIADLTESRRLWFRSADGGAEMDLSLEKVALGDFGLKFSVQTSSGNSEENTISVESVAQTSGVSYTLPSGTNSLTIAVTPKQSGLLGGFGTDADFENIISVELPTDKGWQKQYDASRNAVVISGTFSGLYTTQIVLKSESYTLTATLSHTDLASVEFTGFDSGNPGDFYKGYQQVRVFAKYSYYNGQNVNYLRIPVKALADLVDKKSVSPKYLTWSLTRYVGNEADSSENKIDVKQVGKSVTYNGKSYTIAESGDKYILRDENGEDVTDTATWVDVYSESEAGYARIYFGNFGGLAESDVQNDFFGNFGEQKDWTKKEPENTNDYDGSGRTFQPSAHAYSFLRVEAGDGAAYGKNCHFNFNVLEDSGLVNVFDATGYLSAGKKVVLHNNLYGPGELADDSDLNSKAEADGLILKPSVTSQNDEKMTKDTVYGNGYQINLEVLNKAITALDGGNKNNSMATYFYNLYNVMLKGCNPTENINTQEVKIYLVVNYAYYCDLQYYSKLNGGAKVCLKNTVLRNVSEKALQMWRSNDSASAEKIYLENIVLVNAIEGITSENGDHKVYIKGFFDVLNYCNKQGLVSGLTGGLSFNVDDEIGSGISIYDAICGELRDFLEWHGEEPQDNESYYANLAFSTSNMSHYGATNLAVSVWDDAKNTYVDAQDNKATMSDGTVLQEVEPKGQIISGTLEWVGVHVWTSASSNSTDGYNVNVELMGNEDPPALYHIKDTTRDMSKLFTDDRYIRLLCEYKTPDVKNDDHIMWHMQQVYRDVSLIDREQDHIEHLKSTLKGVIWPDGTQADEYIGDVAALNAMISQAIIPGKASPLGGEAVTAGD